MGHRARRTRALAVLLLAWMPLASASTARAQSAKLRAPVLPALPELRLHWPIAPLSYSFSQSEIGGYANGPLQLFRAESLWLQAPGLRLLTFASSERAFEMDCSLTCQPIAQRGVAVEGRVLLPRFSSLVREPYVFVRRSGFRTPQRPQATGALHVGFAGMLDF